ncbi:MAG: phage terminase large subunit, partial [Rhizobiales bacterium]|nr:phage terminase large subunit [Hyphomicrobiales bacterium]
DDVENDEQVRSPDQRDKLENWILKAVLELGPPDGSLDVFMVGTILHHDSVLSRFLKRPGWKTKKFQAIIQWPDDMSLWERFEEVYINDSREAALSFYQLHKKQMDKGAVVSWPGVRPLIKLMDKRVIIGHGSFDSEYQNDPTATDATFTGFTYYIEPSRDWLFFGAVDPSLGIKGKQGRDPSAILVGGFDRVNNRLDVIEALIRKRVPDLIINDTIAMQKEYGCVAWFVEAVQFQEFFRTQLMKAAIALGVNVPAYPVIPNTDKHLRIETLQPHVQAGNIRFRQEHRILLDQLRHFPKASHDDGPDALEMLWINALKFSQPREILTAPANTGHDPYADYIGG